MPNERIVFCAAMGHRKYITMALALGYSLKLHGSRTKRVLMTDSDDPRLQEAWDQLVPPREAFPKQFAKWAALEATDATEVLVIDADCLAVRNIDPIFEEFKCGSVGVVGTWERRIGEWWGAIDPVLDQLGIAEFPKFNAGLLYFRRTPEAIQAVERAQHYRERYPEFGMRIFRGGVPDEPCLSLALGELGGATVVDPNRNLMATPLGAQNRVRLDVLRGECSFVKLSRGQRLAMRPAIYHSANINGDFPYWREVNRIIRLQQSNGDDPLKLHKLKRSLTKRFLRIYRSLHKL